MLGRCIHWSLMHTDSLGTFDAVKLNHVVPLEGRASHKFKLSVSFVEQIMARAVQ